MKTDSVCGGWRRDAPPCDEPAGWGTSHPGYGRCRLHFGNTPRGSSQAACAEAIAVCEHVAGLMGFPARGDLECELRILEGAFEYCQLRLRQSTGAYGDWVLARYTLVNRLTRLRKKATRSGVDVRAGREITRETLRPHVGPPVSLRLASSSLPQPSVGTRKSAARALTDTALRKLFTAAELTALADQDTPEGEAP